MPSAWRAISASPVASVVVWGVVLRLCVWLFFGKDRIDTDAELTADQLLYFDALGHHLAQFLSYTHTKPPGIYLRDALLLASLGPQAVGLAVIVIAAVMGVAAAALLLPALACLRVPPACAIAVGATWSTALVAWEYWRGGGHWDQPNVFIVALLGWALCRRLRFRRTRDDVIAGAVGGVFVLFYSVAPVVVAVVLACSSGHPVWSRSAARRFAVSMAIPAVMTCVLAGKNTMQFDLSATSSMGGQNMAQTVVVASQNLAKISAFLNGEPDIYDFGHGVDNLQSFVAGREYPAWWRWCFDEAVGRHPDDGVKRFVGALYGECITDPARGLDFEPLSRYLAVAGPERLAQLVRRDQVAAAQAPWLLAGAYAEHGSTTRFAVEYGKVSARVWRDFLFMRPFESALQLARAHFIFYAFGASFFGGDQYEPQLKPRPTLVRWAGWFCAPLLFVGGLACYPIALLVLLGGAGVAGAARFLPADGEVRQVLFVLAAGVCTAALALNALSCCENARFFVNLSPLALPVGVYAVWSLVRRFYSRIN